MQRNGRVGYQLPVNGEVTQYLNDAALSSQKLRPDHNGLSPDTSTPAIVITDLCYDDYKVINTGAVLTDSADAVECLPSNDVRHSGHQFGNDSMSIHSVRQLDNSDVVREIWKVRHPIYFYTSHL